jgi:hypothetical protein
LENYIIYYIIIQYGPSLFHVEIPDSCEGSGSRSSDNSVRTTANRRRKYCSLAIIAANESCGRILAWITTHYSPLFFDKTPLVGSKMRRNRRRSSRCDVLRISQYSSALMSAVATRESDVVLNEIGVAREPLRVVEVPGEPETEPLKECAREPLRVVEVPGEPETEPLKEREPVTPVAQTAPVAGQPASP